MRGGGMRGTISNTEVVSEEREAQGTVEASDVMVIHAALSTVNPFLNLESHMVRVSLLHYSPRCTYEVSLDITP